MKGLSVRVIDGSSILITGGTGSFGSSFLKRTLAKSDPKRVVIFSRDELKQYELRQLIGDDSRVRFFIGDIRDRDRLELALRGIDYVIHTAALKRVDTAEYNPMEYVKTNILGSENVIRASIEAGVKKIIALSTDKASSPINLYGATKLTSDKLFISSNHYSAGFETRMSVVRYGNVMGSRGSVIPFFRKLALRGDPLPITDERMTRFWITLPEAVDFVIQALDSMRGGELFVPRIPSMRVVDLAEAVAPGAPTLITGIRPGEKLHAEMISVEDAPRTIQDTDHYTVLPTVAEWDYHRPAGELVPEGFSYTSDTNDHWLSVDDLRSTLESLGI